MVCLIVCHTFEKLSSFPNLFQATKCFSMVRRVQKDEHRAAARTTCQSISVIWSKVERSGSSREWSTAPSVCCLWPKSHCQDINGQQLQLCTITACSASAVPHGDKKKIKKCCMTTLSIYTLEMSWESQTIHISRHIQGLLTGLLAGIMAFKHSLQGWVNMLQWKTTLCTQLKYKIGSLAMSFTYHSGGTILQ